ncbi:MAG: hypothetical protein K2X27_26585 [Candidatus Obscuribacterales bacterium]|nr:hypothetical protein [Candidatus Obscuribacterales bacterium]
MRQSNFARTTFLGLAVLLWICMIGGAYDLLLLHEQASSADGKPPAYWPLRSALKPTKDKYNLIMFVHPKCPCTNASLNELSKITARSKNLNTVICFYKPSGVDRNWLHGRVWDSAASIPEVKKVQDENGVEARVFRSSVSGQVVLYSPSGHLMFSGGVTAGRAHEGDNLGADRILSVVNNQSGRQSSTSVFGCSLIDAATQTGGRK